MSKVLGCGIEIPYFGANYPDAKCVNGFLWDMDSYESDGYLHVGGDEPCPVCNTKAWLERVMEDGSFETEGDALAYVERLKMKYA